MYFHAFKYFSKLNFDDTPTPHIPASHRIEVPEVRARPFAAQLQKPTAHPNDRSRAGKGARGRVYLPPVCGRSFTSTHQATRPPITSGGPLLRQQPRVALVGQQAHS